MHIRQKISCGGALLGAMIILCSSIASRAQSVSLTVSPLGTNQLVATLQPVVTNAQYVVLVRTNGPSGHWISLATFWSHTNGSLTETCGLGSVPGLTLATLDNWSFVAGRWDDFP